MSDTNGEDDSPPALAARKPYTPPRLVLYGHVNDIVQGAGGHGLDGGGGHSKACWIAEELYGVDDGRTLMLRAWLTQAYDARRPGWMFVGVYRMFGRQVARLIATGVLPRRLFRPLFDALVAMALADVPRAFAETRHLG